MSSDTYWQRGSLLLPVVFLVLAGLLFCAQPAHANSGSGAGHVDQHLDYVLGPGDLIQIKVYDEPGLSVKTRLDQDGYLNYPFLGTIKVAGKTVAQLKHTITQGLKNGYLVNPNVSVYVIQYRPVYITGEVKKPGGYPYVPGLTVQQAVTLAGGFTPLASKSNMYLVPEGDNNNQRHRVTLDAHVRPGDTVIVEEGLF